MGEDRLVQFLNERMDEEEAAAKSLLEPYAWGYSVFYEATPEELAHIERYRPARVLADVQAKRAIIQAYDLALANADRSGEIAAYTYAEGLEQAMTLLAQPFADRPDFDPAWRVSTPDLGEHPV